MSGLPGPVPVIEAREAKELHDSGVAVIVDVREPHEWSQGHVPGSVHIPLQTLPDHLEELPKDRTLILLCHSGVRSHHAANWLRHNGFPDVVNLEHGIIGWSQAGQPIE